MVWKVIHKKMTQPIALCELHLGPFYHHFWLWCTTQSNWICMCGCTTNNVTNQNATEMVATRTTTTWWYPTNDSNWRAQNRCLTDCLVVVMCYLPLCTTYLGCCRGCGACYCAETISIYAHVCVTLTITIKDPLMHSCVVPQLSVGHFVFVFEGLQLHMRVGGKAIEAVNHSVLKDNILKN